MERMPYQPRLDPSVLPQAPAPQPAAPAAWRSGLPVLVGSAVTLRELRVSDAPALFRALTTEQVSRFISPPPPDVETFERFIAWTHHQRAAGRYVCFAVVARGSDVAIGIFQVRASDLAFGTAEWGFALAVEFWGFGLFVDGAQLVVDFAFNVLGTDRLEARAALRNGRGNGGLRKLGAVQEAVLRRSFVKDGEYLDQALWTILRDEWQMTRTRLKPRVIPRPPLKRIIH